MPHKTELHPDVLARILSRRGKLHVHDCFDAARTALLVIDMQSAFLAQGAPSEIPVARTIVPNINRIAAVVRRAGGTVAWLQHTHSEHVFKDWRSFIGGTYSLEVGRRIVASLEVGSKGHELWHELDVDGTDWIVSKTLFSAFLPESSDLEQRLRAHGISTIIITGTVTNVCCDSTARDAMMKNFHVVMVSDGTAAHSDVFHNASLNALAATFCDVMTTDEVASRFPTVAAVGSRLT
jgi:ureidoacrylate peracid hydrolase